ncbi:MAG: hypothetical protein OXC27_09960 [Caldilineaceae bacterium]|nr:hypothetical protein [Caldilineaceae bacterium]
MVSPVAIEILPECVQTFWDRGETGTVNDIWRRSHRADSSGILYLIPRESQKSIRQDIPWEVVAVFFEELNEEEIVDGEALTARVGADQEEVDRILSRYNLLSGLPAVKIPKRLETSSLPR